MKFCIVWKEDKSRQNDSIKSLWNFPTQMTLSEKYDFEEYSPSFWILKQNHWSEMRYAVDNFDFGFLCWDVKNSLFAHLPWYTFASILPRFTPQTKILPNLWGFFYFFRVLQLSQEKLKTMLMQNFWGKQDALYLRRCGIGNHPTSPQGILVFKYGGDPQD